MVVGFIILVALVVLLGVLVYAFVISVIELCHVLNDIELEKWRSKRRDYLRGTGYTEKDMYERI